MSQKVTKKDLLIIIFGCLISAVLYATSIKCFVQAEGTDMLTGGLGGISVIAGRLFSRIGFDESIVYSIFYAVLNVPLMILAYKRIGKFYALFSLINVIITSLLVPIIPADTFAFLGLSVESDRLLIAIVAGILTGTSSGIALRMGSSAGGIDILMTYYGIKKNKDAGFFNLAVNTVIYIAGGFIFHTWIAVLYTIVYSFVTSQMINLIYRRNRKKLVKIVSTHKDDMREMLISISRHGVTIYEAEGGYSHSHKYCLETIVLENEVKNMVDKILEVDPKAFVSLIDVSNVKGFYAMPSFK